MSIGLDWPDQIDLAKLGALLGSDNAGFRISAAPSMDSFTVRISIRDCTCRSQPTPEPLH